MDLEEIKRSGRQKRNAAKILFYISPFRTTVLTGIGLNHKERGVGTIRSFIKITPQVEEKEKAGWVLKSTPN